METWIREFRIDALPPLKEIVMARSKKPETKVQKKNGETVKPARTKAKPAHETAPLPSLNEVIEQAEYKQHQFGQVWQPFDEATFNELVANIDRRGLDSRIMLYQGMILDGWHRYLACLATKTSPQFDEFKGSELEAAELVHASGIRHNSSADQRYASFVLLCDACPEFKAKFEQLKDKGTEQKKAGIPLITDNQRVDVLKTKAEAATVSKSTARKVEEVRKHKPEKIKEIAEGKTSANKVLKTLKDNEGAKATKARKFSFSETAQVTVNLEESGLFEVGCAEKGGVNNIWELYRRSVEELRRLLNKAMDEDDKCEADELPD
jgi:hypothetical protein